MEKEGDTLSETIIACLSGILLAISTYLIFLNILKKTIFELSSFQLNFIGLVCFFIGGLGTLFYVSLCNKNKCKSGD
jgi:hypothetical protein